MKQAQTPLRLLALLLACAVMAFGNTASAQSRFSPIIEVGDTVITRYQLDQRTRFLSLLGAPGDPRDLAREQLINEAVQVAAARSADVTPSAEEVQSGLEEFASRANLTGEEFVAALGQNSVGAETFRDFVGAGVAWRNYVRTRFGDSARENVPDSLIRRTLAQTGTEGGLRLLVSEILLPASTPESAAASMARAERISALDSPQAFATAARELSIAASSARGGELNWVAVEGLPPEIQATISALTPGQISRPVELDGAIGVYLLRDVEQVAAGTPETLSVDYALFITDGDRSVAEAVAKRLDACDDLYAVAKALPEDRLIRETQPVGSLPADVRAEISGLDENEVSTALTRSGRSAVLMLCSREAALKSSVDFEIIGNRLLNTRLGTMAADHLADLRANTTVVDLAR